MFCTYVVHYSVCNTHNHMACMICCMNGHGASILYNHMRCLQTQIPLQSKLSIQFSWFISFHSTASSSFPAKITWCNLHAPSRCRGWWMPTIDTRPSQIQHKSTFITGDNRYVLLYKISFRTDPVNLFRFGFNATAEKEVYCLVLHHIIYF